MYEPREHDVQLDLTSHPSWTPLERQPQAERLLQERQGLPGWHKKRHGKMTGSKWPPFVGYHFSYRDSHSTTCSKIRSERDKLVAEMETPYDAATAAAKEEFDERALFNMAHGSRHEIDALATLLTQRPTLRLRETVLECLEGNEFFCSSQDAAGVDVQGRRVSCEFKCPAPKRDAKTGELTDPVPYDSVKDYYVLQCLAHMEVEKSDYCFFVSWTPTNGTRIWTIRRCPELWALAVDYMSKLITFDESFEQDETLWQAAKQLRQGCTDIVKQATALRQGSTFPSCFATRPRAVEARAVSFSAQETESLKRDLDAVAATETATTLETGGEAEAESSSRKKRARTTSTLHAAPSVAQ